MQQLRQLLDQLREYWADAQAWFARLTTRERRLVLSAGAGAGIFFFFLIMMSFATSAAGYRRRTQDKLLKMQEIQTLAQSFGEAQRARQEVEQQLMASNVRLLSYVQEKGDEAGLEVPIINPKPELALGDGKIIENSVEVQLTDIAINRLVDFLGTIESGPGVVKVKRLRVEPRVSSETLTASATIATYQLKP